MINGYPTEEELRDRICRQLTWHESSDTVALIWHGYISALLEWGVVEVDVFNRLNALLPRVGNEELCELCTGEPLTPDQRNAIAEFQTQGHSE